MSDERGDERIEPPALPNGTVEVLRWRDDDDGRDLAVDDKGRLWCWLIVENRLQWYKFTDYVFDEVRQRLAAELAACRARGDEGGSEAWRLLDKLVRDVEAYRPRRLWDSYKEAKSALGARRAAATATPAGDGKETR